MATSYIKQSWVDADIRYPLSAARLTNIENGIVDAHIRPNARATLTSNQTIATGVLTRISWDTESYDTDNMFALGTGIPGRITIQTAGTYRIAAQFSWATSAVSSERDMAILLNQTIAIAYANQPLVSGFGFLTIDSVRRFNQGDFIELAVMQNTGGYLGTFTTPKLNSLAALLINYTYI